MVKKRSKLGVFGEILAILVTICTHWVVFYFIIINACKTKADAAKLGLSWPTEWNIIENIQYVWDYNNGIFLRSFINSITITGISVVILVMVASMTAFVLQRRGGRLTLASDKIVLAGLVAPLSVIPTYWVLNMIGLNNTIWGLILVEIAISFPVSTMLYKGFIATLPREIDEAAIVDGCGPWRLFFRIELALLKPITATIVIMRGIVIYNDFINPMYFLSGAKSSTVQLCIYTFQSAFNTNWACLFTAIVFVCVPPMILFFLLHKRIMEGVTMGAVKG